MNTQKEKIEVKEIIDTDVVVPINSSEHRIDEIKKEIRECFPNQKFCKAEVLQMWENTED